MIIYFTGTGNSKYLAKILEGELRDEVIDAALCIKNGQFSSFSSDTPYVFIAPTYAWRTPRVFDEWIKKCTFNGSKKAYLVLDCGGDVGNAGAYAKKFFASIGLNYMGIAEVVMPENYIALFSAPSIEKEKELLSLAKEKALTLVPYILQEQEFPPVKVGLTGKINSSLVNVLFYKFSVSAKNFYVTDKCVSCGKCVENCMLNNITLVNGVPKWGKECTHCMACISKCPVCAIEYGKHTIGLRRYVCKEEK